MSLASRSSRMIAAGLIVLAAFSSQSFAVSKEPLPTGKEVMEKYIEKTGGREKYEALKSTYMKGKFEVIGANIVGNTEVRFKSPNMISSVMDITGMGVVSTGTNGVHGWQNSPMTGPRLIEGDELKQLMESSSLEENLNFEKNFKSIENAGIEDVEGKPAYKIELVNQSDKKETRFYDVESGLLVKTSLVIMSQMGEMPSESYFTDYKETDAGISIPFSTTSSAGPQSFKITVLEFSSNVEHPEGTFEPNEEIKELIKSSEPATQPAQ